MAHQRFRKFNMRDRYVGQVGQDIDFGLCMAVRAGNRVFLRGQAGACGLDDPADPLVPIANALAPDSLIAHRYDGSALARRHGAPARAVIPQLYFWKSAKWITGIRFVRRDEPGFWETRGYHNHADPWKEERHSSVF